MVLMDAMITHIGSPTPPRRATPEGSGKVARLSGVAVAAYDPPYNERSYDGEDQGGRRAQKRLLEVVADAATFGLFDEPVGQAARQQIGDNAGQDRDHALLRLVIHSSPCDLRG